MQTSYFAKPGIRKNPAAVSIALWTPRWWGKGRRYPSLAPTKDMLQAGYEYEEYATLLKSRDLDPAVIYEELKDNILCCFCKTGSPCHRFFATYWIETALGFPEGFIKEVE